MVGPGLLRETLKRGEMRNVPSRTRNMARKVTNDENEAHTL
jgi:hypothetical protein